jgi:hypothetical protein
MQMRNPEAGSPRQGNGQSGRRRFLKTLGLTAAAVAISLRHTLGNDEGVAKARPGGISLNYDNSHFFIYHSVEEMNTAGVDAWVDQFAGTEVDQLFFCPNSQRSSVASAARQSVWDGYDPKADNNQPFLAGVPDRQFPGWPGGPNERQHSRNWVHGAWLLHQQGVDPYARWIVRSRKHGIRPWLSMRMNDVHYVDKPRHPIHDRFWKEHPEYRRDPTDKYNGQCFDYGRPEVRTYEMAYVRELIFRYDMDGFELDWMRNPFYFKPGQEKEGLAILTEFTAEVRQLLDQREKEVGHRIQLSARVPDRPETALGLGFDVAAWAERRLIDRLVVGPFLFTQFDIPVERWKELLGERPVTLEAGLMVTILPFAGGLSTSHSPETARGAALSLLDRGAARIYLFNFFDDMPYGLTGEKYRKSFTGRAFQRVMHEIGSEATMAGKPRRHIVTNDDTWAPGQTPTLFLPQDLPTGARFNFRIPTGPAPVEGQAVQVRLSVKNPQTTKMDKWEVTVNGHGCRSLGQIPQSSETSLPAHAFEVASGQVKQGFNEVNVANLSDAAARLVWVELSFSGRHGKWPNSPVELAQLEPE